MLRGRYGNTTGRPYLEGRLSLPRLGLSGDISFIMDTGADKSVLMPLDAARLGLDYSGLSATVETIGIGGVANDFVEAAVLAFVGHSDTVYVYAVEIHIAAPSPDIATIPSLLGRDIMDNWSVTFDRPGNLIEARVVHADQVFPPPSSSAKS